MMSARKRKIAWLAIAVIFLTLSGAGVLIQTYNGGTASAQDPVARGEYLVAIAACGECHTPMGPTGPIEGMWLAGGTKFEEEAFGVLYVPNITPDEETGLGGWTDEEIIQAIRDGVDNEGNPLFIMPSAFYRGLSDNDVRAMVAYLRTIPPVSNAVPEPELTVPVPPPLPPVTEPVPDPPMDDPVALGKYIVDAVSICAECHTPFGPEGPDFSKYLAGGREFVGPWGTSYSANITPDAETGIGTWTEEEIIAAIREGVEPDGERLVPPMPVYKVMTDADVEGVVAYLRTVPPISNEVPEHEPPTAVSGTTWGEIKRQQKRKE